MGRFKNADFLKWLYPGMHIKRWLVLLMFGMTMMGLGFAYILREIYLTWTFPDVFYYLTLQWIPQVGRGAMFMGVALILIVTAVWKLNHSILSAMLPHRDGSDSMVNIIYNQRFLARGPKIVAIGGGTGLSVLLRGLKQYTTNLTAIVTVADDGGSSGRLRRDLGVLPPGDLRNCIAALADAEPLVHKLFQYRFAEGSELAGHSFGNLFIVAMSGVVGNFEEAIRQTSRVLAVRGQIIPSTLANVTLCARTTEALTIQGESSITGLKDKGRIQEVFLLPANPPPCPEAVSAILDADMIVLGPGSLYTSVLPNLLVEGIRQAVIASPAVKVYVCNVATQPGETDGFGVREHLETIEEHMRHHIIDVVVANTNVDGALPPSARGEPVAVDSLSPNGTRLVMVDVVNDENRYHHDATKLGQALLNIYYERGQAVATDAGAGDLVGVVD